MLLTTLSRYPNNDCQQCVNYLRASILENHDAMHPQWSIIVLRAAFLGKYAYNKTVTVSQNERQWSIKDFHAGILDIIAGMEHRKTTMDLSGACIDQNASVVIQSAYNCTSTVHQGTERYTAINCSILFLNGGLCGQSLQSLLVSNITNMHAMSDSSDYFPCSCRVNI
jgi:hypothetical protein